MGSQSHPSTPGALSFAVFAAVLGIDAAAKASAAWLLTEPVRIADWLYLMLHRNSGLFLGTMPVSAAYWICVGAALGWFGWRALRANRPALSVCLAVTLAGLAGNAIGQAQGAVVDFIGLGPISDDRWLVVNLADFAMVAGMLALACLLLRKWRSSASSEQNPGMLPASSGTAGGKFPPSTAGLARCHGPERTLSESRDLLR